MRKSDSLYDGWYAGEPTGLTAFAHFALSQNNIRFYDMDTSLLGHQIDPVLGGVQFKGYFLEVPEEPGIGADMDEGFFKTCEQVWCKI